MLVEPHFPHNYNFPDSNIPYNLFVGANVPSSRYKQNRIQLPSILKFWDVINKDLIHKFHHRISNLKSKAIKIVWAHSCVEVQIPCHCQTTSSIH